MNNERITRIRDRIAKIQNNDIFVYSVFPKKVSNSVKEVGLLGGDLLSKDKELLSKIFGKEAQGWLKSYNKYKDNKNSGVTYRGPNVFFKLPPKRIEDHPALSSDMQIVKINLTKLLEDHPDTIIYGLELAPYHNDDEYLKNINNIQKKINIKEVEKICERSVDDLWKDYVGIEYYAGNVPHAVIITKNGKIDTKYISWQ